MRIIIRRSLAVDRDDNVIFHWSDKGVGDPSL
jgi:hypothetical protein